MRISSLAGLFSLLMAFSALLTSAFAPGLARLAALAPLLLLAPGYYFYCLFRLRELSAGGLEETADFVFGPGSILLGALQRRAEILPFLRECIAAPPSAVAEIGRAKGGTLALLCRASSPDALIVSLDLPGGPGSGPIPALTRGGWRLPLLRAVPGPGQEMRLIDGDSKSPECLARFEAALAGRRLDLIFIDGDHSLAGVRSDFELYSRFVKPGGIIAFHDIHPGFEKFGVEVSRFWRETPLPGSRSEFIEDSSQVSCGIGVLRLP